jgi:phospholipid/cholesterol/gamma-HCH transport system substrate-binding protein
MVGIVVSLAVFVFAVAVFSIGSEQRLWSRKVSYKIRLPNTNGLQVGSPVRLAGVQVGTVTDIHLAEDPNRLDIDVLFSVDAALRSRIRADTKASLKVLSLLSGDRFLELTPGTPTEPELPAGAYVGVPEEMGIEELQELGASIADDLQAITGSLKVILDQLQNRDTIIGQALFDPNFGRETLGNLKETVIAARGVMEDVEGGRGLAGRLLSDDEFADATLASLQGSMARIEELLGRLAGEGTSLAQALDPNGPLAASLRNIEATTADLHAVVAEIRKGKGVAGRLVADEAYAEELLGDLRSTARGLREILEKLNRGDGTAGAFINDPGLYQDMQDVLRGVQKSRIMSGLIRHYRKKGEKDRLAEESAAGGDATREDP